MCSIGENWIVLAAAPSLSLLSSKTGSCGAALSPGGGLVSSTKHERKGRTKTFVLGWIAYKIDGTALALLAAIVGVGMRFASVERAKFSCRGTA
jgi:hypothetical protein